MTHRMATGIVSAIAVIVLTATSGSLAAENPKPDPAQFARGAKAWAQACGACHSVRDPKEFSDKDWDVIVNHMRVIAPLPGATARDIKAFLKSSN